MQERPTFVRRNWYPEIPMITCCFLFWMPIAMYDKKKNTVLYQSTSTVTSTTETRENSKALSYTTLQGPRKGNILERGIRNDIERPLRHSLPIFSFTPADKYIHE